MARYESRGCRQRSRLCGARSPVELLNSTGEPDMRAVVTVVSAEVQDRVAFVSHDARHQTKARGRLSFQSELPL